jgi:hypothetical protein
VRVRVCVCVLLFWLLFTFSRQLFVLFFIKEQIVVAC